MAMNSRMYEYPILKADNFNNWLFRLECLLDEKQLKQNIMEYDITKMSASEMASHSLNDSRAKSIIVQCVSDKHLNLIKDCLSAIEMINVLKKLFQRKSVLSKLHLRRKLLTLKMLESEKLEDYFQRYDNLIRELESMDVKIEQADKVCYLLIGLPDKFDTVITAIETVQDECNLEFTKTRLLDEELKFLSKTNNKDSYERNIQHAFKTIICYKCNKEGHMAYECNFNKFNMKGQGTTRGRGFSRGVTPNKNFNRGRGRGNYSQSTYFAHNTETQNNIIAFSSQMEDMNLENFILDTGATDHLLRAELEPHMQNIETLKSPIKIIVANNKVMYAHKRGNLTTRIKDKEINIKGALIVEDIKFNLLSVSRIVTNGYEINIDKRGMFIYNKYKNISFKANQINKLYTLKMEIIMTSAYQVINADVWHKRLGHISNRNMNILGLPYNDKKCDKCVEGKACRPPFTHNYRKTSRIGQLIHTDVCGPITPETPEGFKYFQVVIDDFSHFTVVYLLKNKSEAEDNLISHIKFIKTQFNLKTARIRFDNGGEFSSNWFKNYCRNKGIQMEYTMAYTPQQNGKSERMNRTLMNKVKTKFLDTNLPKWLWGEALKASTYELNRSPTVCLNGNTPAHVWYGENDLSKLRIFGCKAWAINLKKKSKLEPNAKPYRMIGYFKAGYRLWDPKENKFIESRDVIFDEGNYKFDEKEGEINLSHNFTDQGEYEVRQKVVTHKESDDYQIHNNELDQEYINKQNSQELEKFIENDTENTVNKNYTISGRQVNKPTYLNEYETYLTYCMITQSEEPTEYEQAIKDKEWQIAMNKELNALKDLNTWEIVDTPKNKKIIDTKWVYKIKEDGSKKARLVAKGFQIKNNDKFNIMYAPVARLSTVRMMISKAIQEGLPIRQLDIPTAFLNGKLKSEIYIKVPQGLDNIKNNKALRLNRALYGLIESPKCWNERIDNFLKFNGFKRSDYDYCMYYKNNDCWMIIYVDDIILIGNSSEIVTALIKEFKAKDLGEMKNFLGMEIERNDRILKIKQTKLIEKVLQRFNMTDCKGIHTPMEINKDIQENREIKNVPYRELIGSLMYLTVTSRPDLTFSVSYLSRYLDKPSEETWKAGKRVLRYLKQTKDKGLIFKKTEDKKLYAYSDSDWAGDKNDRKSVSGGIIFYGDNPITWYSKKQKCVSLSSAESEYIAASLTAQELVNLKGIRKQFGEDDEAILLVDNKGAILMAKSNENSRRTKHIDIRYHYIKDLIENEIFRIEYISTEENVADLMTKSLGTIKFNHFVNNLLI